MERFTITFELVNSEVDADNVAAIIEDFISEQFMDEFNPDLVDLRINYV